MLFIFFYLNSALFAQNRLTQNLNGSTNLFAGYNLPEYPFLSTLTTNYIRGVDVNIFKETVGKSEWEQLYNYPDYGISFLYSTLGDDAVFGREIATTAYFKQYFLGQKRLRPFYRMGVGFSYVTRKFDLVENYLNVATGSH
ncbi:MAG: hypothetical protein ACI9G9_000689, partial [Psychromonas sp.]